MNAALSIELKTYARQRWPLSTDEWRRNRLASILNFTARRMKSLYEGETTAIVRAHEEAKIHALTKKKERQADAENRALEARVASLEAQIADLMAVLNRDELAAQRASRSHQG